MSFLADMRPKRMSYQTLLDCALLKRKMKAPPFLLLSSSQTGLTSFLKRQMQEPTVMSEGLLKCWQKAQNYSTVAISATGCRLSSKRSSPFTNLWNQKRRGRCSCCSVCSFSIIYPTIIYGVKWTYNQQSFPMHNQPHRQRQPFLEQFQGRKNAVGREGLMHLLEQQQQSHQRRHEVPSHRNPKQLTPLMKSQEVKEVPQITESSNQTEPVRRSSKKLHNKGRQSQLHSPLSQHRYRADQPKNQFKSQQLMSRMKLPAINKSSSLSHAVRKQHTDIANAQQTGTTGISGNNNNRSISQSKKSQQRQSVMLNSLNKKMQLDSYAMRHLQFLDKFQKQLLHNQNVNKRTMRTRGHRQQ